MAVDTSQLSQLIAEFRALQMRGVITPDSLGYILQQMADILGTAPTDTSLNSLTTRVDNIAKAGQAIVDIQQGTADRNHVYAKKSIASLATGKTIASDDIFIQQATTERAGAMRAQQVIDLNACKKDIIDLKWMVEEAKKALFIELWNLACSYRINYSVSWNDPVGRYNETTDCFELNGITDLTYEEAKVIFLGWIASTNETGRTNLPIKGDSSNIGYSDRLINSCCALWCGCNKLSGDAIIGSSPGWVVNNGNLRQMRYVNFMPRWSDDRGNAIPATSISNCPNLEYINVNKIDATINSIDLSQLPKINNQTIIEMLQKGHSGMKIKLHPDTFDRVMQSAEIVNMMAEKAISLYK